MNKQMLQSLIVLRDFKQENLAKALGISLSRLNAKMNENNAEFTQSEITAIRDRYKLTDKQVGSIFFGQ
ncbi:MAG: hypothetical protein RSA49_00230 [Anaerovoracaceae bacterium]